MSRNKIRKGLLFKSLTRTYVQQVKGLLPSYQHIGEYHLWQQGPAFSKSVALTTYRIQKPDQLQPTIEGTTQL